MLKPLLLLQVNTQPIPQDKPIAEETQIVAAVVKPFKVKLASLIIVPAPEILFLLQYLLQLLRGQHLHTFLKIELKL